MKNIFKLFSFKQKTTEPVALKEWYPELPSLNDLSYKVGDKFLAAFRHPEIYFGNDLMPAVIIKIKENGCVKLQWENGYTAQCEPKAFVVKLV